MDVGAVNWAGVWGVGSVTTAIGGGGAGAGVTVVTVDGVT